MSQYHDDEKYLEAVERLNSRMTGQQVHDAQTRPQTRAESLAMMRKRDAESISGSARRDMWEQLTSSGQTFEADEGVDRMPGAIEEIGKRIDGARDRVHMLADIAETAVGRIYGDTDDSDVGNPVAGGRHGSVPEAHASLSRLDDTLDRLECHLRKLANL